MASALDKLSAAEREELRQALESVVLSLTAVVEEVRRVDERRASKAKVAP